MKSPNRSSNTSAKLVKSNPAPAPPPRPPPIPASNAWCPNWS
jgi:hypothetical protein